MKRKESEHLEILKNAGKHSDMQHIHLQAYLCTIYTDPQSVLKQARQIKTAEQRLSTI